MFTRVSYFIFSSLPSFKTCSLLLFFLKTSRTQSYNVRQESFERCPNATRFATSGDEKHQSFNDKFIKKQRKVTLQRLMTHIHPLYLPESSVPGCSASPPLPHSCSSSDRSTGALLPAGTGTARAQHLRAYGQAPLAIRPGRVRVRRQPTLSRGPPGAHSPSLGPSPWIHGDTGGSMCAWAW